MAITFRHVTGKLANMRKPVEWVVYPVSSAKPHERIIQSVRRIARIDLNTGKAKVSNGKGGHPGFHALLFGIDCQCPEDILRQLRNGGGELAES